MSLVLSIDVGGTKTLAGIVDRSGAVLAEWTQATRVEGDDVERVAAFVGDLARQHAPLAIGAGFPEYVDSGTLTSTEVLRWTRQPGEAISAALEQAGIAVPVIIDSDVRLGALGEARYGAGQSAQSFLYVSLGTGLSSTFVMAGQPWPGARGEAIALGEFPAPNGNLEQFASGTAIAARYARLAGVETTGPAIGDAARHGDHHAVEVLRSAGDALGEALAQAVGLLDPQLVILGGGLGTAGTTLTERARERYQHRTQHRRGAASIVSAQCGHRSGLLGGAAAAWQALAH
ncbi:MAG: ROK family protein [Beutenbergiaceae bacterium]